MAIADIKARYIPKEHSFYRDHYHQIIIALMLIILLLMASVVGVLYQMNHRPLPIYTAQTPDGHRLELLPFDEPNLLPDTIIQWASKAATAAYSFNFGDYKQQIPAVRPYFTDSGWSDYLSSLRGLIETIVQKQLFVSSVVSGAPVISNQGTLPSRGYTWRVQIPFLVSYTSSGAPVVKNFLVVLTIVRVPTSTDPQGIGIDQFVMMQR